MTFQNYLFTIYACHDAVAWVGNMQLQQAWKTCRSPQWCIWLCARLADKPTWPTIGQVEDVVKQCMRIEISNAAIPEQVKDFNLSVLDRFDKGYKLTANHIRGGIGVNLDDIINAYRSIHLLSNVRDFYYAKRWLSCKAKADYYSQSVGVYPFMTDKLLRIIKNNLKPGEIPEIENGTKFSTLRCWSRFWK